MQDLETIIAANRLQLTWEARSYGPVQESSVVAVDVPDLTRAGAVFRPTFLVTRNRVSPTPDGEEYLWGVTYPHEFSQFTWHDSEALAKAEAEAYLRKVTS